jgi:hypothetical protein
MKKNAFKKAQLSQIRFFTGVLATLLLACNAVQAACNANVAQTRPDNRYEAVAGSNGGEVRDKITSLIWLRCVWGMTWTGTTCTGAPIALTWTQVIDLLRSVPPSRVSRASPWRLPNHAELYSLAERACRSPAINSNWFPVTPSDGVWSSSLNAGYSDLAWNVDFDGGFAYDGYKNHAYQVRLVRSVE